MSEARLHLRAVSERGSFITLEGGEGAGKSTQIGHLLGNLREAGIEAIGTREPGGAPGAEILRKVLLSGNMARLGPAAEAILFSAARIDHIDKTIKPALAAGAFVVSDRFADSTRAYQGARGQLDPRFLRALERITLDDVRPDLTLILDLPVAEGLARAAARRGAGEAPDRFEREDLPFHESLRAAFLSIAAAEPRRCIVIDAAGAEEEVAQAIFEAVSNRLIAPAVVKQVRHG
ncbi:MAG: dTMP kinase [Methylocella sp.]|jgi:dTMP kinase